MLSESTARDRAEAAVSCLVFRGQGPELAT